MRNRTPKPKKTFADIDAARKRYNPAVEGYGTPQQWTGSFHQRMGFEEAERVIHGQKLTPRQILQVGPEATWKEIKSAFRAKSMATHPDRIAFTGLTKEQAEAAFKEANAAFAVLSREYGQ